MKKSIFLFIAFCFGLASLNAQETKDSTLIIFFDNITHDYGNIVQGSDGNCVFTFTNNGKTPLLLSNVRSSCGCTVPLWSKEPIKPGKNGVINVKYDTKRAGIFNKTITVNSNAVNSTVILKIKGNVIPKQ